MRKKRKKNTRATRATKSIRDTKATKPLIPKLHDYQQQALQFLISRGNESTALFIRMGLGKTLIMLEYLHYRRLIGNLGKVLIIAPKTVAMHVWQSEIKKWGYNFTINNYSGLSPHRRKKLDERSAEIDIFPISIIVSDIDRHFDYDLIIIDELSMLKESKTKRFKYLKKAISCKYPQVIGLTGTPAPNSLVQLWPQMYLLDGGKCLGRRYGDYLNKYFYPTFTKGYIKAGYQIKPNAEKAIYKAIEGKVLAINIDSCKTPFTEQIIYCDMPKTLSDKYKQLKKELTVDGIDGVNATVVLSKLLQFTSGCVYKDGVSSAVVEYESPKFQALQDFIDIADDNVLVAHWFKHEYRRFIDIGIEALNVDKWNERKQRAAAIHPASMGHGINLQDGGSIIIWYTLPWSLELYEQTIARIRRQGQTKPVRNYLLVCNGTIDEHILEVLKGKKTVQEALMEALSK